MTHTKEELVSNSSVATFCRARDLINVHLVMNNMLVVLVLCRCKLACGAKRCAYARFTASKDAPHKIKVAQASVLLSVTFMTKNYECLMRDISLAAHVQC